MKSFSSRVGIPTVRKKEAERRAAWAATQATAEGINQFASGGT